MKWKSNLTKILVPVLSILISFAIGGIVITALGGNPFSAFGYLLLGAFGSPQKLAQTLTLACPLIFTGLTAAFAYKCGVFNLGGEGQFIIGAVAGAFICLRSGLTGVPGILVSILVGTAAGAVWGAIPGILKVTKGLNEMIVTIMLNYIATQFMGYVYSNPLSDGNTPQTPVIANSLQLPDISPSFHLHVGFFIAVILVVAIAYILNHTSFGFKIKAVGMNPIAARFNGYSVKKMVLLSFIISGAIAGLGGSVELLGNQYQLMEGFGQNFGFNGVAVALIAQLSPGGVAVVAFFFGMLEKGATTLQTNMRVPSSVVDIIQALVIIFAVAGTTLTKHPELVRTLCFWKKKLPKKETEE